MKFSAVRFKSNYDTHSRRSSPAHLFCSAHRGYILHIAAQYVAAGLPSRRARCPSPAYSTPKPASYDDHVPLLPRTRASRPTSESVLFLPHSPTLASAYFVFSLRWTVGACLDPHRPSLAPSHCQWQCGTLPRNQGPDVTVPERGPRPPPVRPYGFCRNFLADLALADHAPGGPACYDLSMGLPFGTRRS